MKMIKIFSGVLMFSSLVYAGGDFQGVVEYITDEASYGEEPIIVEEAYIKEVSPWLEEREEDVYMEPTVEGYVDPILIEEEPIYINSSSYLGNAVNAYEGAEHVQTIDNKVGEVVQEPSKSMPSQRDRLLNLTTHRNRFYAGLGITALSYNIECPCPNKSAKEITLGGITKVGYNFNNFIGIEARGMKINLKNSMGSIRHAGLFLKPMLPLGPVTHAYSLVGVAETKSSGEVRKIDTKSLALGAGMEFGSGKGLGAFVDYEKLVVKSDAPLLDTVSTGVSFNF